jgi:2-phospho-L-lactate guanylyltransferase (CobY/MobA/RfbA family)
MQEKKRKDFGSLMRSQVLYGAAQGLGGIKVVSTLPEAYATEIGCRTALPAAGAQNWGC